LRSASLHATGRNDEDEGGGPRGTTAGPRQFYCELVRFRVTQTVSKQLIMLYTHQSTCFGPLSRPTLLNLFQLTEPQKSYST